MKTVDKFVRVLVVDDSAYARFMVARNLSLDPEIEIIGMARNGNDAVAKIKNLQPDVVTLDVEMPGMDGITALEKIMTECPTPVIMLSALTAEGAEVTIKSLEMGAVDFFLKQSLVSPVGEGNNSELISKVKNAARVDVAGINARLKNVLAILQRGSRKEKEKPPLRNGHIDRVVIIGSSTGGPRALYEVVPNLPDDLPAAFLIVQHMPPKFTRSIAERLNELSRVTVKEAEVGDMVRRGQALIAPGGYHMAVMPGGQVSLNQDKPRCGLRPAVDVTMESAVKIYGSRCIGVVMTGMGSDGTHGCALIKAAGGKVLAEDESTCVVYGMPRSVIEAGLADRVAPVQKMVSEITAFCREPDKACMKVQL